MRVIVGLVALLGLATCAPLGGGKDAPAAAAPEVEGTENETVPAVPTAPRFLERDSPFSFSQGSLPPLTPREREAVAALGRAADLGPGQKPSEALEVLREVGDWPTVLIPTAAYRQLILGQRAGKATSEDWRTFADKYPETLRVHWEEVVESLDDTTFFELASRLEETVPERLAEGRSTLLARWSRIAAEQGQHELADSLRRRQFLEEPVSTQTPSSWVGAPLSPEDRLARGLKLSAAHRSDRVLGELEAGVGELNPEQECQRLFAVGLAHRKLHNYAQAESQLGKVVDGCADRDLARRAAYLATKVISIRSGLRAIASVEKFALDFPSHSMVDDVLFWAGDLYQRRGRFKEAQRYYDRVTGVEPAGDHCADAQWRNIWMDVRREHWQEARGRLRRALTDGPCVLDSFERSRLLYWSARLQTLDPKGDVGEAARGYRGLVQEFALSFYGQLAYARLEELVPTLQGFSLAERVPTAAGDGTTPEIQPICPGWLAEDPDFVEGVKLWRLGLMDGARAAFEAVKLPEAEVVSKDHAASQGVAARWNERGKGDQRVGCGDHPPELLLSLALDAVGAHREAHWRLRTEFSALLNTWPKAENVAIFRAAYPLAHSAELEAAEAEFEVPARLLQGLAREESAFDAEVVSWAGAYGLTQLLYSTGKGAARFLKPPVALSAPEDLLDPILNARLGGALMADLLRKNNGFVPLALTAYNASEGFAHTLRKRHSGHDLDRFVEEITIRETRGYVKRVTRTWGIYRWLMTGRAPPYPCR